MTQEDCQPPEKIAAIRAGKIPDEPGYRYLRAIKIDDGSIAWEMKQIGPVLAKTWPGVLGTTADFCSMVIQTERSWQQMPRRKTLGTSIPTW